jgi:hypothetical protein
MSDLRSWVDEVLHGAVCWGAELDTTYRVLALTVEPEPDRHPHGAVDDRRLQLVLHPCSEVAAQLVHDAPDGRVVEQFSVDQLVTVVDRLDCPVLTAPLLRADPPPLVGELSLEGAARATVMDGRRHAALFVLEGDERVLRLRATYDEVELRRPDGSTVAPPL